MMRLLLTIFFFEVGLVLAVAPWSAYWERNYFAAIVPALHAVITNAYFRGAVSGLGVINLLAAAFELRSLLSARRPAGQVLSIHQSPVVEE